MGPVVAFLMLAGACSSAPRPSATTTSILASSTTVAPVEPWSVVVVGDFGDGSETEYAVAAAIRHWVETHDDTVALITTGDNFYTGDVVAAWSVPYGWLEDTGLHVLAVPGNHDIQKPAHWQANVAAFGSFPGPRAFRFEDTTFVLLDSNQAVSPDQELWLETTVRDLAGEQWIAVFHHPWRSCSLHGSSPEVETAWGDVLGDAALVLNGHDHGYQRFATESGWAVVTGGGGRRLYDIGMCPEGTVEPVISAKQHHFVVIRGGPEGLSGEAVALDGTVIDRFEITQPNRP